MQNTSFFAENKFVLAKGYNHICSASPTEKVTWRGRGAGVKNKSQGAGPFLAEYMRMIFKGWPNRKKVASPGQPSIDRTWWDKFKNFVPTRAQNAKHMIFGCEHTFVLEKNYNHICLDSPTPPPKKKVTWRGRGAGVKNKFQGAGPFLAEYMRMIFKGWPHRGKVASPGQPSIDRKWCDKFRNFVSTRAQNAKHMFFCWKYICPWERVQTHIEWAGNVRIHDLICSRCGLFAKVVVLAAQEIVNTWFNLGGCEIAVSPKASNS